MSEESYITSSNIFLKIQYLAQIQTGLQYPALLLHKITSFLHSRVFIILTVFVYQLILPTEPPSWFLPVIHQIIATHIPTPLVVSLRFELSEDAAIQNMTILRHHSNDIHVYINANKHSFMGNGSEFRLLQVIEPLLHHRSWPSFANQLQQGSK